MKSYTEAEKDALIAKLEIGAILEAAQEQLHSASLDFTRISHNIEAVIANIETAIQILLEGSSK